jgi:glucose-1-phosphate cytidylyltransferase
MRFLGGGAMKTLILAGGYGTRLSEETHILPKPMVEIGGKPILWHIMKIYSHYGFHDFVILLGNKGYVIKEYFANYFLHHSDVTFDLAGNQMTVHRHTCEPWRVTLLDTGRDTQTGGRLLRARHWIGDERFMLTYGDAVGDIDIPAVLKFHDRHGKLATVTSVQPEGRFGVISANDEGKIEAFEEKPPGDGAWVNAGFFVLEPGVFRYLRDDDATILERDPLERLAREGQIYSYRHTGFWKCMDTQRDKEQLNRLWDAGTAGWKLWTEDDAHSRYVPRPHLAQSTRPEGDSPVFADTKTGTVPLFPACALLGNEALIGRIMDQSPAGNRP